MTTRDEWMAERIARAATDDALAAAIDATVAFVYSPNAATEAAYRAAATTWRAHAAQRQSERDELLIERVTEIVTTKQIKIMELSMLVGNLTEFMETHTTLTEQRLDAIMAHMGLPAIQERGA